MTRDYDVVRDPLWDNIPLDAVALAALDTPAVQRLRYVRQLGHAFLVYPGATHTRFEHALGAYHLTQRALAALSARGELGRVDREARRAVGLAALLHDIGHYPFSHGLEEAGFPSHEAMGVALLGKGPLEQDQPSQATARQGQNTISFRTSSGCRIAMCSVTAPPTLTRRRPPEPPSSAATGR